MFKNIEDVELKEKEEVLKNEIRKTDRYKSYMKNYDIAELKSVIIYNHDCITNPNINISKEDLEEIKIIVDTARLALEDKILSQEDKAVDTTRNFRR